MHSISTPSIRLCSPRYEISHTHTHTFPCDVLMSLPQGGDGTFYLWDKDSRQKLHASTSLKIPICCASFDPSGRMLACGLGYDWAMVRHWSLRVTYLRVSHTVFFNFLQNLGCCRPSPGCFTSKQSGGDSYARCMDKE